MSVKDLLGIIKEIVGFFKPIIEPILEAINIISGIYTLASFLEGVSLNANNTTSLVIFILSFVFMLALENELYKWLRSLIGVWGVIGTAFTDVLRLTNRFKLH